jgi:peptidoglycan/LPS O-acetylase OafA/YrhL
LVTLLITIVVQRSCDPAPLATSHLLGQALLLNALPVPGLAGAWNNPAWSVSVEAFCYALVFPLAFRASRRLAARPRLVAVLLAVAVAADYIAFRYYFDIRALLIGAGPPERAVAYWMPLLRGVSMFAGGWLAYLLWLRGPAWAAIMGMATDAVAVLIVILAIWAAPQQMELQMLVLLAPLLVAGLMDGTSVTARLLATAPAVWLGRVSFSLYLIHQPVLLAYGAFDSSHEGMRRFVVPLAATAVIALALFYGVEMPMRRVLRRVLVAPGLAHSGLTQIGGPHRLAIDQLRPGAG